MDITLDKKASNVASIKVNLNEADYKSKVADKIKDYGKKAQIKGFRAGKVPKSLVEKMYGKSILVEEINQLVGQAIQDYIRENELRILGEPLPNKQQIESVDWDNQTDFEFEYTVGLVEDFNLSLDKKVKVTSYSIKVDDKVVDESIDNVKTQFGKMTNPEVSEEGDMLYGTLKQENGDIENETTIDPAEFTKANAKKFVGRKAGDEISVNLKKLFKDDAQVASQLEKLLMTWQILTTRLSSL